MRWGRMEGMDSLERFYIPPLRHMKSLLYKETTQTLHTHHKNQALLAPIERLLKLFHSGQQALRCDLLLVHIERGGHPLVPRNA